MSVTATRARDHFGNGGAIVPENECPNCGKSREEWPDATGYVKGGERYCCRGCAEGTGCICTD